MGKVEFVHGSPGHVKSVLALAILAITLVGCSERPRENGTSSADGFPGNNMVGVGVEGREPTQLEILYPLEGALFPPDIVAPTFRWNESTPRSETWLIAIQFSDGGGPLQFRCHGNEWTVPDEAWETVKARPREQAVRVTISGVREANSRAILSQGSINIRISKYAVEAPLFYRDVVLPFRDAVKDPSRICWRFGKISSKQQPPVILEGLPVCGNCHSFSAAGAVLGMDVDYANDKGSYAIIPVAETMTIDKRQLISWSDFKKGDHEATFGLLSQVSPDGRYVVSTVKDRSVFVATDDLAFSQLFFPIKGILVFYDRLTKRFHPLPGADDRRFVQSNPTWSPDEKYIVFARSKVHDLKNVRNTDSVLLTKDDCAEFLKEGKKFLFDLYRVPFNDGKGGKAEPIDCASNNGMSNYFPRFSPDGKWIVFCRAKSFMLLQPDSELYIMPAEGGQARRLECNTSRMNSWHSWSPNGKWLVFSSKEYSAYTQLFLTQIDEQGRSSVPVVLSRFTTPERAANIPEFVNIEPDAIKRISANFLDDHNYYRAAVAFLKKNDKVGALPLLRKSLEINPKNAGSHLELATILADDGKTDEARFHLDKIFELGPDELQLEYFAEAHCCLASILHSERRLSEATDHYRQALRAMPDLWEAHAGLGVILLETGKLDESVVYLTEAARLKPSIAIVNFNCGQTLHRQGKPEEAAHYYDRAVQCDPEFLPALLGLASIHIMVDRPELFDVDKALAAAEKACEVTRHEHPDALRILAGVYAVAGRLDDAVNTATRAVKIAREGGAPDLADQIQKMLDACQQLQADGQK